MFVVPRPAVPVLGSAEPFPVRRIFCVGKNYAAHAAEMGDADAPPTFFSKPADAACVRGGEGGEVRYPLGTDDLHYEGELVVALGAGGERMTEAQAAGSIFGIAAGCDLTRRDLQREAKAASGPWDLAKGLDDGAVLGPIGKVDRAPGPGAIRTLVNGEVRQDGRLEDMVWPVPALIARLSGYFRLAPGDLIYTGTPEGVGPLSVGDEVEILVKDCAPCRFTVTPR